MDGMLSQDEINALLSGMASGDITMDTLEEELSVLRELAENYDYEAIWDDWYN